MTFKAKFPSKCKECGQEWKMGTEVTWIREEGKDDRVCINANCPDTEMKVTPGKTNGQAISLECRIANLKAFIELVSSHKLDPSIWPACAGVWNATR